VKKGVYLPLALIGLMLADILLKEHLNQSVSRMETNVKNMLITLIYQKHFRISEATLKDFD
jgi:hypothetical protein